MPPTIHGQTRRRVGGISGRGVASSAGGSTVCAIHRTDSRSFPGVSSTAVAGSARGPVGSRGFPPFGRSRRRSLSPTWAGAFSFPRRVHGAEPFREGRGVNAPVIPVPAAHGVLRGGYDTGGFYDEAFELGPGRGGRPALALRRGHRADRLDGRPRRPARGRAREPLVPASRRHLHDLLGRCARLGADPAVRPDPPHRLGRRLGRRRGRSAPAHHGAEPLRARHLPRPGDPARRCRAAAPRRARAPLPP